MKNLSIFWGIAAFLMIAFFLYSFWIAPFSVHHGYYVGAAKLMAEGLVPFKDFNIMDFPLGIWIISLVYRIVGVSTSGNAAVVFLMFIHLTNIGLLNLIMKTLHVKRVYSWISTIFYVLVLYSSDSLMVTLEPIAVLFLQISILIVLLWLNKLNSIACSVIFLIAVLCKYEMIALLPAMCLFVFLEGYNKSFKRLFLFLGSFVCIAILVYYVLSTYYSTQIWEHFIWSVWGPNNWHNTAFNVIIYGGRCCLYFLVPGLILYKFIKRETLAYSWIALVTFVLLSFWFFCEKPSSICQFTYPFITIAFSLGLQDFSEKKRWMYLFFLSALLMPAYLCIREFNKLEYGDIKEEQQSYIELLKEIVPEKKEVSVMCYKCVDYDFGPQVFSEVSTFKPFDLKNTRWGDREWWYADQFDFVTTSIQNANLILMNHDFSRHYFDFDSWFDRKWEEDMDEFIGNHESIAIGDLNMFFND